MAKIAKPDTLLLANCGLGISCKWYYSCMYTFIWIKGTSNDISGINHLIKPRQLNGSHGTTSSTGRDQTIPHEKKRSHLHKDRINERKIHPNKRSSNNLERSRSFLRLLLNSAIVQRLDQRMRDQIYPLSVLMMNGYGVNVGVAVEHSRNDNTVGVAILNHLHVHGSARYSQKTAGRSNISVLLMNG
jgi:hypothetical protein